MFTLGDKYTFLRSCHLHAKKISEVFEVFDIKLLKAFSTSIVHPHSHVRIMSSTYTIRIAIFFSRKNFTNSVWSSWHWVCLWLTTVLANLSNHAWGDCLSPYSDFLSLQTLSLLKEVSSPGGISIYTSSSKSPFRNVFLTSNWCKGKSWFSAKEKRTLIVLSLATGANVSW